MLPFYMILKKNEKTKKTKKKYKCEICDYNTCKLSDYERHLKTNKHVSNSKKNVSKSSAKSQKVAAKICSCGRQFNTRSGLLKHKKTCIDVSDDKVFPKCFQKLKNGSHQKSLHF